jgi:hypothetical protein
VFIVTILTACDIQPSSITVSGRLSGVDGTGAPVSPTTLTLNRNSDVSNPRLEYIPGGGPQDLRGVTITADQSTGLPVEEEFFFLSLSGTAHRPGSDNSTLKEITADPGWMGNHIGDLVVLSLRKDDITLPSNEFDAFQPAQLRPAGASWLARVEDDDPTIPWFIPANSANCQVVALAASMVAPPQGQDIDCFDFQTFTSMLLTSFALEVTDAVARLETPTVTATNHRLYVVPYLPSEFGDPGFGLIYSVDLNISTDGIPLAEATAQVPISMHFRWDGEFYTDPLSEGAHSNPDRVTVTYGSLLSEIAATQIHTTIVNTIGSVRLPTFSGVAGEEVFLLLFNQVSGRSSRAPKNFAVIALPEQLATIGATTTNSALSIPVVIRAVDAPGPSGSMNSVTTNPAGFVTVVRVAGTAPATAVITFTIPRPTVLNSFKLVFLQ